MIVDIPTSNDFQEAGARFLNLAWSTTIGHADSVSGLRDYDALDDDNESDYWDAAAHDLAVAFGLVSTAVEHMLKGRIAAVSPFLLIQANIREWPARHLERNVPFVEFRTHDAQDLPRLHDAVVSSGQRLAPKFRTHLDAVRVARNRLFHGVDRTLKPSASEVLVAILQCSHNLIGAMAWPATRRRAIKAGPSSTWELEGVSTSLCAELHRAALLLEPSDGRTLLGLDRRKRMYLCPVCIADCHEWESDAGEYLPGVAQRVAGSRDRIRCVACNSESVTLSALTCESCACNVIVDVDGDPRCMGCGGWPDVTD